MKLDNINRPTVICEFSVTKNYILSNVGKNEGLLYFVKILVANVKNTRKNLNSKIKSAGNFSGRTEIYQER